MNSSVLKSQLIALFEFQKFWFQQIQIILEENNEEDPEKQEDFQYKLQGHLVKMTCGHRGLPNRM